MSEYTNYRFSVGPWNISEGADPFGPEVRAPYSLAEKLDWYRPLGFEGVQFHVNGADVGSEDTQAPYATTIDTRSLSDGAHTVTAVARDAAGNIGTSPAVTMNVDNTIAPQDTIAPTITIDNPSDGQTVSNTLTVSVTALDNVGIVGVAFFLNGSNLGPEDTEPPFFTLLDTNLLPNDTYTLLAVARDAAGNIGTSAEITIDVDNGNSQPPLPPLQVKASESSPGCALISWWAGTEPDLAGYEIHYGSLSVARGEAPAYQFVESVPSDVTSQELCDLAHGLNYFAVRAFNTSGDYSGYSAEITMFGAGPALLPSSAAIVPDGFWVSDPNRPLEVQNVPLGWTVRIFDLSGLEVRRFQNDQSDNYDWSWDFTNDDGQQVARAIYLIRVTDDSGNVRANGRFVVQIDP